jgi:hypothetical protein
MSGRAGFAFLLLSAFLFVGPGSPSIAQEKSPDGKSAESKKQDDSKTYDKDSVLRDAEGFFGKNTEGLAKVIEKAFAEHGRPNGYIKGEEGAAALTVGLRYGDGTLYTKSMGSRRVYWTGPSIGFDVGGNLSKVFILVYHLPKASALFQRFPGVDGSLYFVGGVGMNYQQRAGIVLAPIRLGVGLRAGASVGYMHYTPKKTYNPF